MLKEFIAQLDSILYSPLFITFQVVSIFVIIGLVVVFVIVIKETQVLSRIVNEWREGITTTPIKMGRIMRRWQDIQRRMDKDQESEWKLAIIEADSIMDEIIKQLGHGGDTMGERMKNMNPGQFPYLDDAWRVHKIRNFIAHDASYQLSHQIAKRTIDIYGKIFKEFNVM